MIEFRSSRRGFNTVYERWCNHNGLMMKEVWTKCEHARLGLEFICCRFMYCMLYCLQFPAGLL